MNLLQPGTQLDGRYEVVKLLGQGGMATVYQVRHLGLHSTHALKVLNADLARNDDIRSRFLGEGRIQARLRHPNIVQVTEIVTTPVAGLVMDYVEGPTLGELCRERGLEPQVLLEVFLPVLDAVEEAHKHNVVHRDLKPDNIIIGKDNRGRLQPKVTDFGIAKVVVAEGSDAKARTQAGARMGTLLYMSPEQIRGAAEVDARSDIFSLGAILYEAATGRVAFHASSDYDTMKRIVEGTYEPPDRVVGSLHPVIAGCIRKALAVDPAERFQDCAAFREALEQLRAEHPEVPAKPSRSYGVTQVGHVAPPAEPVSESAFAKTHVPVPGKPGLTPVVLTPSVAAPPSKPEPALEKTHVPVPGKPGLPVAVVTPRVVAAPPVPTAPQLAAPLPDVTTGGAMSPVPPKEGLIAPNPTTSPFMALVLSLVCCGFGGFGQMYNQQVLKGLCIMGLWIVMATNDAGIPALASLGIVSAIDAYRIASKRRQGKLVGSWEFF